MITKRILVALAAALAFPLAASPSIADDGGMEGGGGPAPARAPSPPAAPAPADAVGDVLVLADGSEVRGRITAEDDHAYAVKVGGAVRLVEKSAVKEVRRGAPGAGPPAGDGAAPKPDAPPDARPDARRDRRPRRKAPVEGDAPADAADPGAMDAPAPPPLSDAAKAWARVCLDRFLGADAAVRRSAGEALKALGPAVAPLVREAAAGAGEAAKYALEEVARAAEERGAKAPGATPKGAPRADGRAPDRARAVFDRVRDELGLDDRQSATVGARLLEYGRDLRETMADARDGLVSYEDARTKAGELRSALRESLKTDLTAEQMGKLDAILDSLAPGGKSPGGKPGKKAPPAKDPQPGQ